MKLDADDYWALGMLLKLAKWWYVPLLVAYVIERRKRMQRGNQ